MRLINNKINILIRGNMKQLKIKVFLGLILAVFMVNSIAAPYSNNQNSGVSKTSHKKEIKKKRKKQRKKIVKIRDKKKRKLERTHGEVLVKYKNKKAKRVLKKSIKKAKRLRENLELLTFDEDNKSFDILKDELLKDSEIESVEPNIVIKTLRKSPSIARKQKQDLRSAQRNTKKFKKFHKKKLRRLKRKAKSGKAKVAIIDTGIDFDHPDLVGSVAKGVNVIYVPNDTSDWHEEASDSTEMDYNGHGTMVAGIIGAQHNEIGVDGISSDVTLVGIKAFDNSGTAYLSDVLTAMDVAIEKKVDIINMSFGIDQYSALFEEKINEAHKKGIILIGSAGNEYAGRADYPAKFDNVISVGCHDEDHKICNFSNWGDEVDFYAPGVNVVTSNSQHVNQYVDYAPFTGTSASAAYASGIIALSIEEGLTKKQAKKVLKKNLIARDHNSNPDGEKIKELNIPLILADFDNEKQKSLAVTKFDMDKKVYNKGEVINAQIKLKNTGNQNVKQRTYTLKVLSGMKLIELDRFTLPSIAAGKTFKKKFQWDISKILKKVGVDPKVGCELRFRLEDSKGVIEENLSPGVIVQEGIVTGFRILASWVDHLQFNDSTQANYMNVIIENVGNSVTKGLKVDVYAEKFTDEYLLTEPKNYLAAGHQIGSLEPNTRIQIKIPLLTSFSDSISKHLKEERSINIVTALTKSNGDELRLRKQTYLPRNDSKLKILYCVNNHRDMVKHAIDLLRNHGISQDKVPDLYLEEKMFSFHTDTDEAPPEFWKSVSHIANSPHSHNDGGLYKVHHSIKVINEENNMEETVSTYESVNYYSMTQGVNDRDAVDLAFGYTGYGIIGDPGMWDSHFWVVDNGDDDGNGDAHSALNAIRALMWGNNESNSLKNPLFAETKTGGAIPLSNWYLLGHAVHNLQDVALPEHVNDENSHGALGASYEWWAYENYSTWTLQQAVDQGGIINPYQRTAQDDPIRFLAYTSAQVGNSFPYSYYNNGCQERLGVGPDCHAKSGNRVAGGDYPHYDAYMNDLFNAMPKHPVNEHHINRWEILDKDWFSGDDCYWDWDLYGWFGETHSDCKDGNGIKDVNNGEKERGNNADGDLTRIRDFTYSYAVRATAGLIYYFLVETGKLDLTVYPELVLPDYSGAKIDKNINEGLDVNLQWSYGYLFSEWDYTPDGGEDNSDAISTNTFSTINTSVSNVKKVSFDCKTYEVSHPQYSIYWKGEIMFSVDYGLTYTCKSHIHLCS